MSGGVLSALGRPLRDLRARWRARTDAVRAAAGQGGAGRGDAGRDDGFILLESMVAISMITVILAALAGFTIDSVQSTNELRARQAAVQIASGAMAGIDILPATDLVTGRDATSVAAQFAAAPAKVQPWLAAMTPAVDTAAAPGAGATAGIPTTPKPPTVLNNISFSVEQYLGTCAVRSATSTDCVVGGTGITMLRSVVAVTWAGTGCGSTVCAYVTATLINTLTDPVFNTNRATPPVKPIVVNPGNQTSTVGATVSLQLAVQDDTGVPPFTWQLTSGTLPTGLTMSAAGLISGSPTVVAGATTLKVTVLDAFGRAGTDTFTWTVVAAPTITTPAAQSTQQGQSASLPVASTCPHTPCTFSMANAPAGLSINASTGAISGTPTTAGTYATVTITITDVDLVSRTTSPFTWTVVATPTVSAIGNRILTVGQDESVAVTYTCPTTPCTLTLANGVPGVGLSTVSTTTGNNTAPSLSLTSTTGTVYLAGTVQTTAVPSGTSRVWTPAVTITKGSVSSASSGTWTAYSRPTIGAVGNRTVTVGATKSVAIAYTCPNLPCTLTLANPVPGLGLSSTTPVTTANATTSLTLSATSGTVYIAGKVSTSAVGGSNTTQAYVLGLTLTDADAATATTSGTWTASTAPKITNPGTTVIEPNQNLSQQIVAACPNGGCTWAAEFQYGSSGPWYTLPISSTGLITASNVAAGTYTVRVTLTDSDLITDQVTYSVVVTTMTLAIPTQTTSRPASGTKTVTFDVSTLVSPSSTGYTYSLSGAPTWLTINSTTGLLTATIGTASLSDTSITVTVTSTSSSTSNVSSTFAWNLT